MNISLLACLTMALLVLSPQHSWAQQNTGTPKPQPTPIPAKIDLAPRFKHAAFTFVRVQYNRSGFGHSSASWMTDYPDADLNFMARFEKATGLPCAKEGKTTWLTNAELSRFPFIYMAEGGRLQLSDAEVASLRTYLLGGGFLMVDDFCGVKAWESLRAEMKRVFPELEPVDLPLEHPVFHSFYDLQEKPQVPNAAMGIRSQYTGITWERQDGKEAHYRALRDGKGRLMAVFCHNTDLADGWERQSENQYYYTEFSMKKAFPMGINIVVYALTN